MYHGRYYRLDTDVANIEKGIAVFRYCPDGKTDSGIYVTFSDDEIEFYFNSRVDDTIKNATILTIPLDDNTDRSFASTVTDAFHSKIDDVFAISGKGLPPSYHSTFHFGSNSKQVKIRKKPRTWRDIQESPDVSEPLLVRRMILDFLFDLKETRIFQMSPHYGDLTEKLRHNFFARCLVAKARYWYQRALYEGVVRESRHATSVNDRKARKSTRQFYGEILVEAEKEWADCIRDARSDQTFHDEYHGWFDDSETEMRRIYLPYLSIALNEGVSKKLKKEHDKNTSTWFVMRHVALTAWRILLSGNTSFFGVHLLRPRILFAIGVGWITMRSIGEPTINNIEKSIPMLGEGRIVFVLLMLVVIFAVSWILIWRVVPLVQDIFIRALRFSCFVLLVSLILGCLLSPIIQAVTIPKIFLATFLGITVQIFLRGGNANEPM